MSELVVLRDLETKLCALSLSRSSISVSPLGNLHTLNTLPPDVVNIVSKNSDLICCEGQIRSEFLNLQGTPDTFLSRPKFHESHFLMIRDDYSRDSIPFVMIFDMKGKEIRRFQVTLDEHERIHFHQFAVIGNDIFFTIKRYGSAESAAFDSVVVYDLQGNFKRKWLTKFFEIEGFISYGEHILLTTHNELYIQVFNQHGEFSHKFGDYELWGESNRHIRCSLFHWTHGRVMVSYRGSHRLYSLDGKLLQVMTFEDFGFSSNEYAIVKTCVTKWNEILFFTKFHRLKYEVYVFKHVSTKVELQRTFVIEITADEDSIHSVSSLPNGSICIVFKNFKIYVYK